MTPPRYDVISKQRYILDPLSQWRDNYLHYIEPIVEILSEKGRIEWLFRVLQDRLIAKMELSNITDMEAANWFLKERFIAHYNRQFVTDPETPQRGWREIKKGLNVERSISFRYNGVVGNDNAVRAGGIVIDIPEGPAPKGYAKARAKVRQLLDGSWRVHHKDTLIARTNPTPVREQQRAKPRRRSKCESCL